MSKADQLSWTIARYATGIAGGTIFAASYCAIAGVRLSQELLGCRLSLCGRGGAYDLSGILSLHARHWLFNQRPHAYVSLSGVFNTLSEPHALMATPAQVDGSGNANLSVIGDHAKPKVAFGGTRGLPDARAIHFVLPSHNARQLVERVAFISTSASTRQTPSLLITELGVMRWHQESNRWRLEAVAPGISASEVQDKTRFEFEVATDLKILTAPTEEALAMLEQVDPLGLREMDFVSGRTEQLDAIARIYDKEVALVGEHLVPGKQIIDAME